MKYFLFLFSFLFILSACDDANQFASVGDDEVVTQQASRAKNNSNDKAGQGGDHIRVNVRTNVTVDVIKGGGGAIADRVDQAKAGERAGRRGADEDSRGPRGARKSATASDQVTDGNTTITAKAKTNVGVTIGGDGRGGKAGRRGAGEDSERQGKAGRRGTGEDSERQGRAGRRGAGEDSERQGRAGRRGAGEDSERQGRAGRRGTDDDKKQARAEAKADEQARAEAERARKAREAEAARQAEAEKARAEVEAAEKAREAERARAEAEEAERARAEAAEKARAEAERTRAEAEEAERARAEAEAEAAEKAREAERARAEAEAAEKARAEAEAERIAEEQRRKTPAPVSGVGVGLADASGEPLDIIFYMRNRQSNCLRDFHTFASKQKPLGDLWNFDWQVALSFYTEGDKTALLSLERENDQLLDTDNKLWSHTPDKVLSRGEYSLAFSNHIFKSTLAEVGGGKYGGYGNGDSNGNVEDPLAGLDQLLTEKPEGIVRADSNVVVVLVDLGKDFPYYKSEEWSDFFNRHSNVKIIALGDRYANVSNLMHALDRGEAEYLPSCDGEGFIEALDDVVKK